MEASQLFYYLSGFPRQMLPAVLVFFLPMRKKHRWYLFIPALAGMLGASIGLGALLWPRVIGPAAQEGTSPLVISLSALFFALHYLLVCSSYAASLRWMCGADWHEAWYCVIFAYISEHVVYCVKTLGSAALSGAAWWSSWPMSAALGLLVYGGIWCFFARKICRNGRYPSSVGRSLGLIAVTFLLVYIVSIVTMSMELEWLHSIYALICCSFIMASEYRKDQQLWLQGEIQERERIESLRRAQYEMSKENIAIINRKSHDLRRQVEALRTVGTPEEQAEAIRGIEQAVEIYDRSFQTGSRALDTVLMQKALLCSQQHIELSVMADGSLLRFIKSVDLFTMVSNILDNAIEASLRIPEEEKRSIHLSVHQKRGLVILQCENPYVGTVEMKDGLPVTIKADKANHGIGTRSIAATAAEYGGVMRIDPSGGMYVLRIIFQPPDANQDEKTTSQDKAV
ncbi:MAG: GHKL domain-containing protein [Clostridia bacterium]|nr:GHKL domain-containing protein [Clostridia bacterium]